MILLHIGLQSNKSLTYISVTPSHKIYFHNSTISMLLMSLWLEESQQAGLDYLVHLLNWTSNT